MFQTLSYWSGKITLKSGYKTDINAIKTRGRATLNSEQN